MVADSDALRSRRRRRHVAGDHTLCRPNCTKATALREVPALPPEATVLERMEALARRLEAAHDADPANGIVARELRLTLEAIARAEPSGVDLVGELRDLATRVS